MYIKIDKYYLSSFMLLTPRTCLWEILSVTAITENSGMQNEH